MLMNDLTKPKVMHPCLNVCVFELLGRPWDTNNKLNCTAASASSTSRLTWQELMLCFGTLGISTDAW